MVSLRVCHTQPPRHMEGIIALKMTVFRWLVTPAEGQSCAVWKVTDSWVTDMGKMSVTARGLLACTQSLRAKVQVI